MSRHDYSLFTVVFTWKYIKYGPFIGNIAGIWRFLRTRLHWRDFSWIALQAIVIKTQVFNFSRSELFTRLCFVLVSLFTKLPWPQTIKWLHITVNVSGEKGCKSSNEIARKLNVCVCFSQIYAETHGDHWSAFYLLLVYTHALVS